MPKSSCILQGGWSCPDLVIKIPATYLLCSAFVANNVGGNWDWSESKVSR